MLYHVEQWLQMSPAVRRREAEEASRRNDAEALWSLTEAYLGRQRGTDRHMSDHTRRSYRHSISVVLHQWSGDMLLHPHDDAVKRFVLDMRSSGLSPASFKVRIAGVHALYRALCWAGAVERDPFADLPLSAVSSPSRPRVPMYTDAERNALLNVADPVDRAMVLLCSEAGLGVSECVGLQRSDLDVKTGRLTARDGTGRVRTVALTQDMLNALQALPQRPGESILGFASEVRARQRMQRLSARAGVPYRGLRALQRREQRNRNRRGEIERRGKPAHAEVPGIGALKKEMDRALALAQRSGETCGFLMIDIEGTADILEEYGHAVSQDIVAVVEKRIDRVRRPYDFVAQIGDGRFGVLLMRVPSRTVLHALARRFAGAVHASPIDVQGRTARITVGVGGALGSASPADLMREATEDLRRQRTNVPITELPAGV